MKQNRVSLSGKGRSVYVLLAAAQLVNSTEHITTLGG